MVSGRASVVRNTCCQHPMNEFSIALSHDVVCDPTQLLCSVNLGLWLSMLHKPNCYTIT